MLRKSLAIFSCLGAMVMFGVRAYSHCHNDGPGPETNTEVKGTFYWPASRKIPSTKIYELKWKLNPRIYNNRPSLLPDVTDAADEFKDIEFQSKLINVQFKYMGITSLDPQDNSDNKHTVGYAYIGQNNRTLAYCYRRVIGNVLQEFDIVFNYYKQWKNYGTGWTSNIFFCIQEIATHEFGHAWGLNDVYFKPYPVPISTVNCPHHAHYTMNGSASPGEHFRMSLACEDKYALRAKYGDRNK